MDPALTAELLVMANSAAYGGAVARADLSGEPFGIWAWKPGAVDIMAATSALRSHAQRGRRRQYLASVWAHSIATAVAEKKQEALGDSCEATPACTRRD